MKTLLVWYSMVGIILSIFSYGFIDPNFPFLKHAYLASVVQPVMHLVYDASRVSAMIYSVIIGLLFFLYAKVMLSHSDISLASHGKILCFGAIVFFLSYPALSYDIFNYILTAKVAYTYQENPYVVMPIELLGEPMLAYTRAANKVALYGPIWILATWIPHLISVGSILLSVFAFKALVIGAYGIICACIYKLTHDIRRVMFFALNPLVIIETFVNGHNDAFMMALALGGIVLLRTHTTQRYIYGWILITASIFVKGATGILIPFLLLFHRLPLARLSHILAIAMFGIFLATPLREELYPWYAIWWLVFVSLLPVRQRSFIHGAAYALSFGLMLRYIPWIATREYGGTAPLIRVFVTWIPLCTFVIWHRFRLQKR